MTTTISLPNTPSDSLDMNLIHFNSAAKALLENRKVDVSADGNSLTAQYVYDTGAAGDPVLVRVNKNYNPKTDITSCSIRLITRYREVDNGTSEVLLDHEVESVISVNYAGRLMRSSAHVVKLVSLCFSLWFNGLIATYDTPDTSVMDRMDRGSLGNLFES